MVRAPGVDAIRSLPGPRLYNPRHALLSSSRACRHLPTVRRPAPTGFMRLSTTAIA